MDEELMGVIKLFAGTFAPRGYMLCQGQTLSIAQNSALFAILGTNYGGDGQTTFKLPDLQNRFPLGTQGGGGNIGQIGGSTNVSLTAQNMPMHNHAMAVNKANASTDDPTVGYPAIGNFEDPSTGNAVTIHNFAPTTDGMNPTMIAPAGGSQPFNVQNPFLTLNYIICVQGIFPSRN